MNVCKYYFIWVHIENMKIIVSKDAFGRDPDSRRNVSDPNSLWNRFGYELELLFVEPFG
jgi:hypothetical protein